MMRESGGDIRAQNPTSSASGKWQFIASTWAGYGGYAEWYLWVAGWGSVFIMIVGAFLLPQLRWRHDPDRFEAWPTNAQLELKEGAR